MQLSSAQWLYLAIGQLAVPVLINVVLNGAIGFAMFRGASEVPWLGTQSIVGDTLGTGFFLPAITCLIVTPLVRGHVRKGAAEPMRGTLPRWLGALPRAPSSTKSSSTKASRPPHSRLQPKQRAAYPTLSPSRTMR